jgi:hypothetical protein
VSEPTSLTHCNIESQVVVTCVDTGSANMGWCGPEGGGLGLTDAHNMSVLVEVYGAICLYKYRPVLGISEP